jgi:hypothetical protein
MWWQVFLPVLPDLIPDTTFLVVYSYLSHTRWRSLALDNELIFQLFWRGVQLHPRLWNKNVFLIQHIA